MTNATPTGSVCPLRRPPKGKDHPSASRTAFFGLPPDSRNPSSPQPSRLLDSPHHHADVGLADEKSGLKVLEERLKNTSFQRIHRNALVNVDHVRKMSALSSQRWLITLSNEQEFIASKRQAHGIRRLVSWQRTGVHCQQEASPRHSPACELVGPAVAAGEHGHPEQPGVLGEALHNTLSAYRREIGRASCRER